MSIIYTLLGVLFSLAGLVCWIGILVDAFKDSIWKGFLGLLCGLYLIYYALVDFEHDNKLLIVIVAFFGSTIGAGFMSLAR